MEIKDNQAVWLDFSHPNYQRWLRGRESANERAIIVNKIISSDNICKGLRILDVGSGEGSTSAFFSESNWVVSYDLSLIRLKRQRQNFPALSLINGKAETLPFQNSSFDLIILQDVIEHIPGRDSLVNEIKRVLKNSGFIYLSTPNRFSIMNIISDPHWGIPLLSLFNRNGIKRYFLKHFRKKDLLREDLSQLLSLREIYQLFNDQIININTKEVINLLSEDYKGIIWSNFHVKLYCLLKKSGIILIIKYIVNNKPGFINKYLTPTFFLIIKNNPFSNDSIR
ncbi:MAG TPA: class I SAM-dependent methyltransferase [Ignavibacteriaceae bacterium]|nr:class I SAM-dependent methyltransferase [Ignavibacteriaceae bacterium]